MSSRGSENKIILIKRKTRLEELVVRYNTIQQAQFYIERLGADFSDYLSEDFQYRKAVETAVTELSAIGGSRCWSGSMCRISSSGLRIP